MYGEPVDAFVYISGFGYGGFQKLTPCGNVIKQIPNHERRAVRTAYIGEFHLLSAVNQITGTEEIFLPFGNQFYL